MKQAEELTVRLLLDNFSAGSHFADLAADLLIRNPPPEQDAGVLGPAWRLARRAERACAGGPSHGDVHRSQRQPRNAEEKAAAVIWDEFRQPDACAPAPRPDPPCRAPGNCRPSTGRRRKRRPAAPVRLLAVPNAAALPEHHQLVAPDGRRALSDSSSAVILGALAPIPAVSYTPRQ